MRVVVDTNVFISSFFGGNPRKIIDLWKERHITLCLSRKIINEYFYVLIRLGLADEFELGELVAFLARGNGCLFTAKTLDIRIVEYDADDDKFFHCAINLKAKYIITGDKHIRETGSCMGITICSPGEFITKYFS